MSDKSTLPILDSKFDPEAEFQRVAPKLKININSLSKQMAEQPAMFGHYIVRYRLLKAMTERAKSFLGLLSSELVEKARADYQDKEQKCTEAKLKSESESHPHYQAAFREYHDLNRKLALAEGIIEALRVRGEMLLGIGYNQRFEKELHINETQE